MIIFLNATNRENSRTLMLARHLLKKISAVDKVKEIKLYDCNFPKLTNEVVRDRVKNGSKYAINANEFKLSDTVVIAAPYYDLSFPSVLKTYIESVSISGITFDYKNGLPVSLCNTKNLYYVTTAGGKIINDDYGYGYIKEVFKTFFGVKNFKYIKAEMLDYDINAQESILKDAMNEIDSISIF